MWVKLVLAAAVVGVLGASAPARADDPEFTLNIKDHKFDPTELTVPANVKVKLIVKNLDPTPEEFESNELHREKVVGPGQQILVYVGPLSPGVYGFFGDFHQETAQGKLIVK
jgi:plastocyanin